MKEYLKKLYVGTGKLFDTIASLLSVILFSSLKSNAHFKKQRKMRKEGETCHILCNGPSLSQFLDELHTDLNNVYVVNFFATTDQYEKIKPNNYIILDNVVIGKPSVSDDTKQMVLNLYNTIAKVTTWPLTFYYPSSGIKEYPDILRKNKNISVVIFNMTPIAGLKSVNYWLFKNSMGMPWPQNISNAAVFCALNSGYKKIYLYGVEHSWLKSFEVHPETHKVYMNDGHFYEKENIRWFEKGEYCQSVKNIHRALQSHFELRDYADYLGAKVINKTATSYIEAYEFDEY